MKCPNKTCRGCLERKPLSDFYKHSEMKDGHLNHCKDCKKAYAKKYAQTEAGRATERRRSKKPARRAHLTANTRRWRSNNPDGYAAHYAVQKAKRKGVLKVPDGCESCGSKEKLHAHHEDYKNKLDVVFLCPSCHGRHNPNYIPF